MAETILLLLLISGLILFVLYIFIKGTTLSKRTILLTITFSIIAIVFLIRYTGVEKIKADIVRVIRNSGPKEVAEVYSFLFRKPADSCVTFINFKDQVIPAIDCCIWMEIKLCPKELNRVIRGKKYQKTRFHKSDSLSFLNSFTDRPQWWTPQVIGDSITKYTFKINQDKEQTIFSGDDSSHMYLCDKAL